MIEEQHWSFTDHSSITNPKKTRGYSLCGLVVPCKSLPILCPEPLSYKASMNCSSSPCINVVKKNWMSAQNVYHQDQNTTTKELYSLNIYQMYWFFYAVFFTMCACWTLRDAVEFPISKSTIGNHRDWIIWFHGLTTIVSHVTPLCVCMCQSQYVRKTASYAAFAAWSVKVTSYGRVTNESQAFRSWDCSQTMTGVRLPWDCGLSRSLEETLILNENLDCKDLNRWMLARCVKGKF